ncbi:MAG TPA: hypothetical protein VGR24_02085 [bacterium]|nr:hypothetical protein [bacterium]
MPTDPYLTNLLKGDSFYAQKTPVTGRLTVILRGHLDDRGLELIPQRSRVVTVGEVHELLIVDDPHAGPGRTVSRIAALGFVEFTSGGVLLVGDRVSVREEVIGHLVGYDMTHMPNHMNIVIGDVRARSGEELGLELSAVVTFAMPHDA